MKSKYACAEEACRLYKDGYRPTGEDRRTVRNVDEESAAPVRVSASVHSELRKLAWRLERYGLDARRPVDSFVPASEADTRRTIALRVDAERKRARMTFAQLALRSGVSVETISRVIYDRHALGMQTVSRVAGALGVDVPSLLESKHDEFVRLMSSAPPEAQQCALAVLWACTKRARSR